jgi:hypothetical protein
MTGMKAKVGYFVAGVLLTVFALYPLLRETRREQPLGLLLSPEEIKSACGNPQRDDIYTLAYSIGDRRVELEFMGANHRMFLHHVKWAGIQTGVPTGSINQVTKDSIAFGVKNGLPSCFELAAQ